MNKISPFINFFSIKVVVIQQKVSCFQIVSIMYWQYSLILISMWRLHLSSLYVGHICIIKRPRSFGNKVKIGNKVKFGNKVANWCNIWSIEGVIVYGHVPECHVTFGRGRLHNVWWDPHIDHKTSWGTISNVPWHIPVRGA